MPVYEFHCNTCSQTVDHFFNKYDNRTEMICEVCGKSAHRIPSIFNYNRMDQIVIQARKDNLPVAQQQQQLSRQKFHAETIKRKKAKYRIMRKKAELSPSHAMTIGPGGSFGGGIATEVKVSEQDKAYFTNKVTAPDYQHDKLNPMQMDI